MKKFFLATLFFLFCSQIQAQNVGIGTTNPVALLHVADSSVLFTGPVSVPATTLYGPPSSGAGTRMIWYPQKAAFRAGVVDGIQWDKDNIGRFSFAAGNNTKAPGEGSFSMGMGATASGIYSTSLGQFSIASGAVSTSMGYGTIASGEQSTSMGVNTTANGSYSTSMGGGTNALGDYSTSMGFLTTASGFYSTSMGETTIARASFSTSMGHGTIAKSPGSLVAGQYNDTSNIASVLEIGNGTSDFVRKNALTVLMNGNVGIGSSSPNAPLQLANTIANRKIVLFEVNNNNHQFIGLGINNDALRYQVSGTAIDHAFFAAASSSNSIELMRIKGNGNIGIGNSNPLVPLSFPGVGGKKISLYPGGSGDAGMGIYPNEFRLFADNPNADITFGIDDYTLGFSEKIRFKANGNMGIGTSNPLVPLAFSNTLGNKIALYTNSATSQYGMGVISGLMQIYGDVISADIGFGYGSSSNFTERMRIKGTGFVGIGTSNPTQALHVVGNIFATGTITPSDARYKKNIEPIEQPLEKLQRLNGVTYNYRSEEFPDMKFPDATQVGLIAQEVEKVFPQLVFTDDKGYKAVDYVKLIPLLIETAKVQQKQEETLQQKVNKQQEEIDALKILVEKLLDKN